MIAWNDVEILEQPIVEGAKFRFESSSRGGSYIIGANSTKDCRTYPGIKVRKYAGCEALITVSCVSDQANLEGQYAPHPHKISSYTRKYGEKDLIDCIEGNSGTLESEVPSVPTEVGFSVFKTVLGPSGEVRFSTLKLCCTRKENFKTSLELKKLYGIDPYGARFDHINNISDINADAIRICFEVTIRLPRGQSIRLLPVVSHVIKTIEINLVIHDLSVEEGTCEGGTKLYLLCDKLPIKEEVRVRFFNLVDGEKWKAWAKITEKPGIFKRVVVVCTTPPYRDLKIESPVKASVQLVRISDSKTSNSVHFRFLPTESVSKRKRDDFSGDFDSSSSISSISSDSKVKQPTKKAMGIQLQEKTEEFHSGPPNLNWTPSLCESINIARNFNDFDKRLQQSQPLTTYNSFENSAHVNKNLDLNDLDDPYNLLNYHDSQQDYNQFNVPNLNQVQNWSRPYTGPSYFNLNYQNIQPVNYGNGNYLPTGLYPHYSAQNLEKCCEKSSEKKRPDVDLLSDELSSVSFD